MKLKELPPELFDLVTLRYIESKNRVGITGITKIPQGCIEFSVSSLFIFSGTPEYKIDDKFWSKVSNYDISELENIKKSPAYPNKSYDIAIDVAKKKLDNILIDKQFYDKYWI